MFKVTNHITAKLVLRSEGMVYRYSWTRTMPTPDVGRNEAEHAAYAYLRDYLGMTKAQAKACIAAAQADADAEIEAKPPVIKLRLSLESRNSLIAALAADAAKEVQPR